MNDAIAHSELAGLWRASIAAQDAVGAAYADPATDEHEIDRRERSAWNARTALATQLHLIGLTADEIKACPL